MKTLPLRAGVSPLNVSIVVGTEDWVLYFSLFLLDFDPDCEDPISDDDVEVLVVPPLPVVLAVDCAFGSIFSLVSLMILLIINNGNSHRMTMWLYFYFCFSFGDVVVFGDVCIDVVDTCVVEVSRQLLFGLRVNLFHVPPCTFVRLSFLVVFEFNHSRTNVSDNADFTIFICMIVVGDAYNISLLDRIAAILFDVRSELSITRLL